MPIWGRSIDRVYEALAASRWWQGCKTKQWRWCGSVRLFQGVTTRTDPSRTEKLRGRHSNPHDRHVLGAPFRLGLGRLRAPSTSLPLGA